MEQVTLTEPLVRKVKETGEIIDKIETVFIRRLKTGDLLSAIDAAGPNKEGALMAHLISRATRLNIPQVHELELQDFAAISEVIERFLPTSLRTGRIASNSSPEVSDSPQDAMTGEPSS